MGEIIIRINGRVIERIIYIFIIIILGILLFLSYTKTSSSDTIITGASSNSLNDNLTNVSNNNSNNINSTNKNSNNITDLRTNLNIPSPDETCTDNIKNQGETAIDCGGPCTSINGAYWYDDACHKVKQPTLSGKLDISVLKVNVEKSPTSDALKVKSISVKIDNGLKKTLSDGYVVTFAKTISGILLNQFNDNGEDTPYSSVTLPVIKSGSSYLGDIDISGAYIFADKGYDLGDDFKLDMNFYDGEGNLQKKISKIVKS